MEEQEYLSRIESDLHYIGGQLKQIMPHTYQNSVCGLAAHRAMDALARALDALATIQQAALTETRTWEDEG